MATSYLWMSTSHLSISRTRSSGMFIGIDKTLKRFPGKFLDARALASRKSVNKLRKEKGEIRKPNLGTSKEEVQNESNKPDSKSQLDDEFQLEQKFSSLDRTSTSSYQAAIPTRDTVLRACTITSGLLAGLGIIIRQASHVASTEGWPVLDCSAEVSFGFEIWHLELTVGLVILISSCRYLLLKTWPDFAESSEAANRQVLTSLQPLDYIVVAFLPGFSEELLFRGALLPLFGFNWNSALAVAAMFGFLHLGSGRKYSFAIWATFVGLAYGYATILSSSIVVPMLSHALNNLVGGLIWKYTSETSD